MNADHSKGKPSDPGGFMETQVGLKAQRSMTVIQDTVDAYVDFTGDFNPLHFDIEFTSKTRFERLIAQGSITTGLLHAQVPMDMPGSGTVFTNQNWSFPKPVYIGDTIQVEVTVKSAHRRIPMAVYHSVWSTRKRCSTVYQATPST